MESRGRVDHRSQLVVHDPAIGPPRLEACGRAILQNLRIGVAHPEAVHQAGVEIATDTASDAYLDLTPAGTTFTVEVIGSSTSNEDYDLYDLDIVVLGP